MHYYQVGQDDWVQIDSWVKKLTWQSTGPARKAAQAGYFYVSQETMKPRYLTTTLSISALCLLSACVGVPVHDIRNSPIVYESVSSRSMNDVLSCLTAALDQFRGDSRMLTTSYPQPPVIEISIGAIQMGSFRHHYLLMITSFDEGAKIVRPEDFPTR